MTSDVDNGAQVLEAFTKFRPDLLSLSYAIQNRHPLDIVREVRQTLPETRTVLLGDSVTDEEIVEAIRNGARAVLPKDVVPQALVEAWRRINYGEALVEGRVLTQMLDQLTAKPSPIGATNRLTTRELVSCL